MPRTPRRMTALSVSLLQRFPRLGRGHRSVRFVSRPSANPQPRPFPDRALLRQLPPLHHHRADRTARASLGWLPSDPPVERAQTDRAPSRRPQSLISGLRRGTLRETGTHPRAAPLAREISTFEAAVRPLPSRNGPPL